MQTHYLVTGMTCQHCVAHVTEEVSALEGVDRAEVGLDGTMVVTSQQPIALADVERAVAEAGDYTVAEVAEA